MVWYEILIKYKINNYNDIVLSKSINDLKFRTFSRTQT